MRTACPKALREHGQMSLAFVYLSTLICCGTVALFLPFKFDGGFSLKSQVGATSRSSVQSANSRPVLIFVHIPKCSGSTIEGEYLQVTLRSHRMCAETEDLPILRWWFQKPVEYKQIPAIQREALRHAYDNDTAWNAAIRTEEYQRVRSAMQSCDIAARHIPYGIHRLLAPRPTVYIAMLREPRQRLISSYFYFGLNCQSSWNSNSLKKSVKGLDTKHHCNPKITDTMPQWLRGSTVHEPDLVDNCQARYICGPSLGVEKYPIYDRTHGAITDCALSHLPEFAFVGLVEDFSSSMCLLYELFNWGKPPLRHGIHSHSGRPTTESNTSSGYQIYQMDDKLAEQIASAKPGAIPHKLVIADNQLYEHAQLMFQQRLLESSVCGRERENGKP